MSLNFRDIRVWNGSQAGGFEELCCQLAEYENVPEGSRFVRKGAPDAGIECYWQLPNGHEWGWQAKYFFRVANSQWAQLDESVDKALSKHPRLVRYVVCLPINRGDPRVDGRKSLMDRWNDRVEKWQEWAAAKGMSVEFKYWGESGILSRLSQEKHAGRRYFWFNKEELSREWFEKHFEEVRWNAGPRYTPEIHVGLPVAELFEGLGRTDQFYRRIMELYGQICRNWTRFRPTDKSEAFLEAAGDQFEALVADVNQLVLVLSTVGTDPFAPIDFDGIYALSRQCREVLWDCFHNLQKAAAEAKERSSAQDKRDGDATVSRDERPHDFGSERHLLYELQTSISQVADIASSNAAKLANLPALLLVGDAGVGKTHLFCDVARNRLKEDLPTVLLLGQHFTGDEPWDQIIKQVHLSRRNRDEFLGGLDAAAQATGKRALILIDALNEGEGKHLWVKYLAGMLAALQRFPRLGLAVNCRTSYEEVVIPEALVRHRLVREVHLGFAEHEFIATRTFFDHYGIEHPTVPLLVPEFQNPLFLKLFCQGLKNQGLTRIPPGLQGITSIFEFFTASVNHSLARSDRLDFAEKSRVIQKAVDAIARLMAESGKSWVPWDKAQEVVDALLPRVGYHDSLFGNLIFEGLLAEDRFIDETSDEWVEGIRFPYEKFADHIVVRYLLDEHLDAKDPASSFEPDKPLGNLVRDRVAAWQHSGIVEALCIHLPERIGKELFEVAPCKELEPVQRGFVQSLIWRDPSKIGETAMRHMNEIFHTSQYMADEVLDAILTVATNPDHPMNAEFLHKNLLRLGMPERDAWWSVYLHEHYGNHDAVDRLMDWAVFARKGHFGDEPIRLCAVALAWFLTTPNRFVRDQATKGLVALLRERIHVLRQAIEVFLDVDDIYVLERLFAVAYGCAMLSEDKDGVQLLARDVYRWIFEDGGPPAHILLRDYARGVIELALCQGINLDIDDLHKVRPPYRSEWPSTAPSVEELELYSKDYQNYGRIYHSTIGMGDFARYVVDRSVKQFTARPLDASKHQPPEESLDLEASVEPSAEETVEAEHRKTSTEDGTAMEEFLASLNEEQRIAFEEAGKGEDDEERKAMIEGFVSSLGPQQSKALRRVLSAEESRSMPKRDPSNYYDLGAAQRWIFQRVLDLGWTPERFGEFDRRVSYNDMRASKKAERFGKKYQWIALHELLARIADNCQCRIDPWDKVQRYAGPWQLGRRDLDPSVPIRKSEQQHRILAGKPWWQPVTYSFQGANDLEDEDWLRELGDCPDPVQLIEITTRGDGTRWLTLEEYYHWEEPVPIGEERYDRPRRGIWYQIRSYVVRQEDADALFTWLNRQHLMDRWMPESGDFTQVFLGEFPWASAFKEYHRDWSGHDTLPYPVVITSAQYLWEDGYDCSIDETISALLPSDWLVTNMRLEWARLFFRFVNSDGQLVAFDPSTEEYGPRVLLLSKPHLEAFLAENKLEILWTVRGAKWILGGTHEWRPRLEIDGVYRLQEGNIVGRPVRAEFVTEHEREKITLA